EALKNPTVRFAYDRFGPSVLQWSQLSTPKDYMRQGLLQSSGYHIVSGFALFLISGIGRISPVKFWRYLLFFTILASELAFLVYPSPSPSSTLFPDPAVGFSYRTIFHVLFPYRVAYQHILFLHQMFVFLSVALTRVAPQLFPQESSQEQEAILRQIISMAAYSDKEGMQTCSLACLEPDDKIMDKLAAEMENMIIEGNVKKDMGPLKTAWDSAIRGARGRFQKAATAREEERDRDSPGSAVDGEGKLPSPRPSPPPSMQRKGSSYMRARSVSY
ncbi:hypothetical protein K435DRAFT_645671, partial [Dendrothele bispora CBS 962.96]